MTEQVLLTGISGYLGLHMALGLLKAGHAVRGSVRDLAKTDAIKTTLRDAGARVEQVEFVQLDLLADAGWNDAMRGITALLHVASPTAVQMPRDETVLIRPAVEGTRRAVAAALRANVRRIVVTSSTDAIRYGDHAAHPLTEDQFSDLTHPSMTAYAKAKTMAENEAWRLADRAGRRETLSVINPGVIVGPLLDADEGTSPVLIRRLLDGKMPRAPRISFPMVDVADVVDLHLDAMTNPDAGGQRCLAVADVLSMSELGQKLAAGFPGRRVPVKDLPDWLVRLVGRFDRDIRTILPDLGRTLDFHSDRATERLKRPLRDVGSAAVATGHSLVRFGYLNAK